MQTEQIALVRTSWNTLVQDFDEIAELFYRRLFELDPHARHLLAGDMHTQGRKMIEIFSITIAGLEGANRLVVPVLRNLGQRHQFYGVVPKDYLAGEEAFLWALQQKLGTRLTPDLEQAWRDVYHLITDTMQAGMAAPTVH